MSSFKVIKLKNLLIEDLETRKLFIAKYNSKCDIGGETIEEGDEFFFFGEKQKVCNNCREEMAILVAEQVH